MASPLRDVEGAIPYDHMSLSRRTDGAKHAQIICRSRGVRQLANFRLPSLRSQSIREDPFFRELWINRKLARCFVDAVSGGVLLRTAHGEKTEYTYSFCFFIN